MQLIERSGKYRARLACGVADGNHEQEIFFRQLIDSLER